MVTGRSEACTSVRKRRRRLEIGELSREEFCRRRVKRFLIVWIEVARVSSILHLRNERRIQLNNTHTRTEVGLLGHRRSWQWQIQRLLAHNFFSKSRLFPYKRHKIRCVHLRYMTMDGADALYSAQPHPFKNFWIRHWLGNHFSTRGSSTGVAKCVLLKGHGTPNPIPLKIV